MAAAISRRENDNHLARLRSDGPSMHRNGMEGERERERISTVQGARGVRASADPD